jgi:hypothetical protein
MDVPASPRSFACPTCRTKIRQEWWSPIDHDDDGFCIFRAVCRCGVPYLWSEAFPSAIVPEPETKNIDE